MDPDHLQHDCPATLVITEQYSSPTFVSFDFNSDKEEFGMRIRDYVI
jgi:hypothetical protein